VPPAACGSPMRRSRPPSSGGDAPDAKAALLDVGLIGGNGGTAGAARFGAEATGAEAAGAEATGVGLDAGAAACGFTTPGGAPPRSGSPAAARRSPAHPDRAPPKATRRRQEAVGARATLICPLLSGMDRDSPLTSRLYQLIPHSVGHLVLLGSLLCLGGSAQRLLDPPFSPPKLRLFQRTSSTAV
jgi:hypothetical protein